MECSRVQLNSFAHGYPVIPGEGGSSPLQCSRLVVPMDRGVWRAVVYAVAEKLDTT